MICIRSLDDLIAALPVAMLGVDGEGAIVGVNEEAEVLLRHPRSGLLGRPVEILVPEAMRDAHRLARASYWLAPADRAMAATRDLTAVAGDGTELSVRISLKSILSEHGRVTLAGIVDLTSEKRLARQLRDQFELMELRIAERTADLEAKNREMAALLASLETARAELESLSRLDPLTGLTNRREFDDCAERKTRQARRGQSQTCVAMLDLDHFKGVNDRFGHQIGDLVLRRVAEILKARCRADDLLARYGGEEFVLLLPETTLTDAYRVVERMRVAIEADDWSRIRPGLSLTISAGLARHDIGRSIQSTIEMADRQLYESKAAGRNRVLPACGTD